MKILEEIGDVSILVAQMAAVSAVMIGLAATGYGAAAEALGFVLLAVGAAFAGRDLLAGIIELIQFFTTVDDNHVSIKTTLNVGDSKTDFNLGFQIDTASCVNSKMIITFSLKGL